MDNNVLGHRKRLREKYLKSDIRTFQDYEILEMLLFYALPRGDTKAVAKQMLLKFGSLAGVIAADASSLKSIAGVGESAVFLCKVLLDFHSRLFIPVEQNSTFNVLNNWNAVLNYCRLTMGQKSKNEAFRVLYLNKKNKLIADLMHDHGTVDRVQVYPREIAQKVLEYGASAIIMVHNHPSGEAKPSHDDIEVTRQVANALSSLSAIVHDHIIVTRDNHFSFKANKLI